MQKLKKLVQDSQSQACARCIKEVSDFACPSMSLQGTHKGVWDDWCMLCVWSSGALCVVFSPTQWVWRNKSRVSHWVFACSSMSQSCCFWLRSFTRPQPASGYSTNWSFHDSRWIQQSWFASVCIKV